MEKEFKILKKIVEKPTRKSFLVAIPVNMYRIQTFSFIKELNFFQKVVLQFKVKPDIKNSEIASLLGLDEKLVAIVEGQLESQKLLDKMGSVTEDGKHKLEDLDGLTVDKSKREWGYVFQYVDRNEFYPYYISDFERADIDETRPPRLLGLKGDNPEYLFYFNVSGCMNGNCSTVMPNPDESTISALISHSSSIVDDLSLYCDDSPDLYWLCTYVYLPTVNGDIYESDWQVLDPFGRGDSMPLKFYIMSLNDLSFKKRINECFSEVNTIEQQQLKEFQAKLEDRVECEIENTFDFVLFSKIDMQLQLYVKDVVRYYLRISDGKCFNYEDVSSFIFNLQNALETIFKIDRENRSEIYNRAIYSNEEKKWKNLILANEKIPFWNGKLIPLKLKKAVHGNLRNPISLRSYFCAAMLTVLLDEKNDFVNLFKGKAALIDEIAELRNISVHGHTENEKKEMYRKEKVIEYYFFFVELINKYIKYKNNE